MHGGSEYIIGESVITVRKEMRGEIYDTAKKMREGEWEEKRRGRRRRGKV